MSSRILVIDDDRDMIKILRARLEKDGYDVVVASNGVEGMEEIKKQKPDLILLDLGLPIMDGYTMLKELKRSDLYKDIPIIVLSGRKKVKELIELEGVVDFLAKPFGQGELNNRIQWHLLKKAKK